MYRVIQLAICVVWIAGCNASPTGPIADVSRLYKGSIPDRGDEVVVRPANVRAAEGGLALDIEVEGPREDALWVAGRISREIFFFRHPDVQELKLTDAKGPVTLRRPREETGPLFGTVYRVEPTYVIAQEDGRARAIVVVWARSREVSGPVAVELPEARIAEVVRNYAPDSSVYIRVVAGELAEAKPRIVGSLPVENAVGGELAQVKARDVRSLRVEKATLKVVPQPPKYAGLVL
jgi:hypothetical protein